MKRVYVTTVLRRPKNGKVGNTYAVDWETKVPLWDTSADGVRGVVLVNGKLLVGNGEHGVKQVNPATGECEATWEYPELGKIHMIYLREGGLVLASTANDNRAVVDLSDMRLASKECVGQPNRDSLHFNSIGWDVKGREYHLYHRPGIVVRHPTREIIFEGLKGAHDLEFIDDHRVIINDSPSRKVLIGNVKTKQLETVYEAPDGPSTTVAKWGFTRGAAYHEVGGLLFTGSSPVDLHMFEVDSWKRLDWLRLSSTRDESIFDILLDPRDW